MTTSEEKRLQNRKHQQNYRKKPGYNANHAQYMAFWRKCKRCGLAHALRTFARLQFERMEREGVGSRA